MLHKKQKAPLKPTKSPGKKQKAPPSFTKPYKKGSTSTTPQASSPHEMRPLGRISGGAWGDWSPHKITHFKNADGMTRQF